MKNRIYVVCLMFLYLLPACSQGSNAAQQTGAIFTFKFLPENDEFFVPAWDNGRELEKLSNLVANYKEEISKGNIPVAVNGYCTSFEDEKKNLELAKVRSNRVKSELITRNGIREENFVTTNSSQSYERMKEVVIVSITIPQKKEEPVVGVKKEVTPEKKEEKAKKEKAVEVIFEAEEQDLSIKTFEESKLKKSNYAQLNLHFNLLHWITLSPDLGIELTLNRQLTLIARGAWTDWSWKNGDRTYYFRHLNPELRYYWSAQRCFYTGAEFHSGSFDVKLNDTGRKGDFTGYGLTTGYVLYINRSLAVDFNIGLGYTRVDYDKYLLPGYNIESQKRNLWGLTQAGISLVWKVCK